jgi:hypothetical protein
MGRFNKVPVVTITAPAAPPVAAAVWVRYSLKV